MAENSHRLIRLINHGEPRNCFTLAFGRPGRVLVSRSTDDQTLAWVYGGLRGTNLIGSYDGGVIRPDQSWENSPDYDGIACPVCGSDETQGTQLNEIGAEIVVRSCRCQTCGATYDEHLHIASVRNVQDAHGNPVDIEESP